MEELASTAVRVVGRYALYGEIASGGMASVHFGRLLGPVGFARTVAIKRLHEAFARDPEFVSMFLDEARLAARIRHPNVVPTLDVVATEGELFLVMEYVQGETLSRLARTVRDQGGQIPVRVAVNIVCGALQGLHAAHEARDERGVPLGIVHRDVSPQNVIVGADGMARLLDFGVAKAAGRVQVTREGQVKGKLAYMAPEQLHGETTRRTDIYAASVMFWELLTGRRLFSGDTEAVIVARVLKNSVPPPSKHSAEPLGGLDEVVAKGLEKDPAKRFATAREMAQAIERCVPSASLTEVADWLEQVAGGALNERAKRVAVIETATGMTTGLLAHAQVTGKDVLDALTPSGAEMVRRVMSGTEPRPEGAPAAVTEPYFAPPRRGPPPAGSDRPTQVETARGVAAPRPPRPERAGAAPPEPQTGASSISVSLSRHAAPRRMTGRKILVTTLGVLGLLAIGAVAFVLGVRHAPPPVVAAPAPEITSVAPRATAPPAAVVPAPPEAATEPPSPVASPAPSSSAAARASASARPTAGRTSPPVGGGSTATARPVTNPLEQLGGRQ